MAFPRLLLCRYYGATGSILRVHGPFRCLRDGSILWVYLSAVVVLLIVSYLFGHPLPPKPFSPYHPCHGQKEDQWRRAKLLRQSGWLPEGRTPRRRRCSTSQQAHGQGQAGSRCNVGPLCPVRKLCLPRSAEKSMLMWNFSWHYGEVKEDAS